MAEERIDKLSIEISADADKASQGLDKLTASLSKLQTIIPVAFGKLNGLTSGLEKLSGMSDRLSNLGGIGDSLSNLAKGMNAISGVDMSAAAGSLEKMSDALKTLPTDAGQGITINVSNISSGNEAIEQMKQSFEAAAEAGRQMTEAVSGIGGVLSGIKQKMDVSAVAPKMKSAADSVKRFSNETKAMHDALKNFEKTNAAIKVLEETLAGLEAEADKFKQFAAMDIGAHGGISPEITALLKENTAEINRMWEQMDILVNKAEEYRNIIKQARMPAADMEPAMAASLVPISSTAGFPSATAGANAFKDAMNSINQVTTSVGNALNNVLSITKKFASTTWGGFKQAGSGAIWLGEKIRNIIWPTKQASSATMSWAQKLTVAFKRMIQYKILRGVLSGITNAVKEGMQNLARYSDNFNASMSELITSTLYLKNSIGAMLAPVLQAIIPVFSAVTDQVVELINYVGMLFAKLTGATTYTQAVRYYQNYADSLDGAKESANELTKSLAGFDTLQKLTFGTTTAATGAIDYSQMFQEVELADVITDPYELGASLTSRLTEAFDSINWAAIQTKANEIAGNIASFLNGAIDNKDFWSAMGKTIGEGINTAIGFAQTLLDKINWAGLGKSLATALNDLVNTIKWSDIGATIAGYWNSIFETLGKFFRNFDWANLGQKLADGLYSLITTTNWAGIGQTIADGFNGVLTMLYTFFTAYDWTIIGASFATGLNSIISGIDWDLFGRTLGAGIMMAFNMLYGFVTTFDWAGLGLSIATAINGLFSEIDWARVGETISSAILGLFGMIRTFLQGLDWAQIGKDIGQFLANIDWGAIFSELVGIIGDLISGVLSGLVSAFSEADTGASKLIIGIVGLVAAFSGMQVISGIIGPIIGVIGSLVAEIAAASSAASMMGVSTLSVLAPGLSALINPVTIVIAALVGLTIAMGNFDTLVEGIMLSLDGLGQFLKGVFTANIEDIGTGLLKFLTGIGEALAAIIDSIIELINKISGLNIPTLTQAVTGTRSSTASATSASVSSFSVPMLADGATISPNDEFLAILGDQTSGRNIEAPEGTLEEIFTKVISQKGASGNTGPIILNVDGRELARVTYPYNQGESNRRGTNLITQAT